MSKTQLYYTLLTDYGLENFRKASFDKGELAISHLAVGDGNGKSYEPTGDMDKLKNETYRCRINHIYQHEKYSKYTIFEALIPPTSGGYTIREAGLFDEEGKLFAIAKMAETVKPSEGEGGAKELYIRLILELSNAENVNFTIDPSAVAATHKWSYEHFAPISHISDFNNPHKVTAAQVGAWAKSEHKRISHHYVNIETAKSFSMKADDPDYKDRGTYATHVFKPRFSKSLFIFTGTYYANLAVDNSVIIHAGLRFFVNNTLCRVTTCKHNGMSSRHGHDYAEVGFYNSIPSFLVNTNGQNLTLKTAMYAGRDQGVQPNKDPIVGFKQLNMIAIEIES